jgi:RNA polymerase sigma-70 factor, ECF subfamily
VQTNRLISNQIASHAEGCAVVEPAHDQSLVNLCRKGDDRAAKELFDRYVEKLHALAQRRISQRLASRVDPDDIVQSVFRTFFGRLKQGQFKIDEQDDVGRLLVSITVHKTLRQIAFHKADKRNPNAEVAQANDNQEHLIALLDREPTPEATAMFLDQLEHFFNRLRPQEREILELRMQGYNNEEIAEKLGIYDRKIRRCLEHIRGLAEQEGITPLGTT